MNKKRTTHKLSVREISTILNRRSKNYALAIGISTIVVIILSSLNTFGLSAFDFTAGSTLYIVALFMVLMLVPSFIQHLVNASVSEKSRVDTAKEPASFSILRWMSFVTLGLILINSKELWASSDSIVVDYVALLYVVGIVAVGCLFALVMAGRYYDKKWKSTAGLVFTGIAAVVGAVQLLAIVTTSI